MFKASAEVITLDEDGLAESARRLAQMILHGFQPDLVVPVARGGIFVADAMREHLPASTKFSSIRIQRPATGVKARKLPSKLLARLPRSFSNTLRSFEVWMREKGVGARARRPFAAEEASRLSITPAAGFDAVVSTSKSILIVDDTVDSGLSLRAAVARTASINPEAEIRTAVLASTWQAPPFEPDYVMAHRTLIRFPWSFDF